MIEHVYALLREAKTLAENNKTIAQRFIFVKVKQLVKSFLTNPTENNNWFVLCGLRGVGKTTIMFDLYNDLISKNIPQENILYLSADRIKHWVKEGTVSDLVKCFIEEVHNSEISKLNKKLFVLIDEAHYYSHWNLLVKSIHDRTNNVFFFVTGSSALAININADISRRMIKKILPPMNFSEYLLLKYDIWPVTGFSSAIRDVILYGPDKVNYAQSLELKFKNKFLKSDISQENALNEFLKFGGLASNLTGNEIHIREKTLSMIEKIITQDLPLIKDVSSSTSEKGYRLLSFLASKELGPISIANISKEMDKTSTQQIYTLLNTLEQTELIIKIRAYTDGKKILNQPSKYYFSTPSLLFFANHLASGSNGKKLEEKQWENGVASQLFYLTKKLTLDLNLFYDPYDEGVDFLLIDNVQKKIIPIEVGINKKTSQVHKAIRRYSSPYGIIVTNTPKINYQNNIIYIPLNTFLLS